MKITRDEALWLSGQNKLLDPLGVVFFWRNKFFRAIYKNSEAGTEEFMDIIYPLLYEKNLFIKTSPSSFKMDSFSHLLESPKAGFALSSKRWSREMLRTAALVYLEAFSELLSYGYGFLDGHTGNIIQTYNGEFKLVDAGSFTKDQGKWLAAIDEFMRHFTYPLLIASKGTSLGKISSFFADSGLLGPEEYSSLFSSDSINLSAKDFPTLIKKLSDFIKNIDFPSKKSDWSHYYNDSIDVAEALKAKGFDTEDPSENRDEIIRRFLDILKPETVIDLGANAGLFSYYAEKKGAKVLCMDTDLFCIDDLHLRAKKENFKRKMSFSYSSVTEDYGDLKLNDQAQCVLALALTHHLFLGQRFKWQKIAEYIAFYCKESGSALVEFMLDGLGKPYEPSPQSLPPEYLLARLSEELDQYFEDIEIINPYTNFKGKINGSRRVLFVCRKRNTKAASLVLSTDWPFGNREPNPNLF